MKGYLNKEELNSFMLIGTLLDAATKIRQSWMSRNNMTKEEHRTVKTAETNLTKFYESVLYRLDISEREKIFKRMNKFEVRILDEYTLKKLARETDDKYKNAVVPRKQFESWCRDIMHVHCKGCSKDFATCELHTYFHDNFVPESTWGLDNCRYAYAEVNANKNEDKIKAYEDFKAKRRAI